MATTERVRCNFCNTDESTVIYSEGELKLVKCASCGFNYVNPRIKTEELIKHYDESHSVGNEIARRSLKQAPPEQEVVTDSSWWSQKQWKILDRWLLNDLRRIMKYKKGGRLLDVGCGDGKRLQVAFDNGWKDVYGLEVSDAAVDKLKKKFNFPDNDKHFKNASILTSGFPDNFFDVVTYWSVLEHVVDPVGLMSQAHRLLNPGGMVMIQVPNARSLATMVQEVFPQQVFRHMSPIEHIMVFTESSLNVALDRTGFEPFAYWYHGLDFYELVTNLVLANANVQDSRLYGALMENLNELQQVIDNRELSDRIIVCARKKH